MIFLAAGQGDTQRIIYLKTDLLKLWCKVSDGFWNKSRFTDFGKVS